MYTQVSLGMRFRMMFETEESGVRRYMGTITGISDLDPVQWKNSQWRNLQVRICCHKSFCHAPQLAVTLDMCTHCNEMKINWRETFVL